MWSSTSLIVPFLYPQHFRFILGVTIFIKFVLDIIFLLHTEVFDQNQTCFGKEKCCSHKNFRDTEKKNAISKEELNFHTTKKLVVPKIKVGFMPAYQKIGVIHVHWTFNILVFKERLFMECGQWLWPLLFQKTRD